MKDFLKIVAGIVLLIAVSLGVLTFPRNYNRKPSVFLTDNKCSPPCWTGIVPGQTSSSQVYEILDKLDGVNKDTIMGDYEKC